MKTNVKQLIEELTKIDSDKTVILVHPDGIEWDFVGKIKEETDHVKIIMKGE